MFTINIGNPAVATEINDEQDVAALVAELEALNADELLEAALGLTFLTDDTEINAMLTRARAATDTEDELDYVAIAEAIQAHTGYTPSSEDRTPKVTLAEDADTYVLKGTAFVKPTFGKTYAECTSVRKDKNGDVNIVLRTENGSDLEDTLYKEYFNTVTDKKLFPSNLFTYTGKIPQLNPEQVAYYQVEVQNAKGLDQEEAPASMYRIRKTDKNYNDELEAVKKLFPTNWEEYIHTDKRGKFICRMFKVSQDIALSRLIVRISEKKFAKAAKFHEELRQEKLRKQNQMETAAENFTYINKLATKFVEEGTCADMESAIKLATNIIQEKGFNM